MAVGYAIRALCRIPWLRAAARAYHDGMRAPIPERSACALCRELAIRGMTAHAYRVGYGAQC